MFLFSSESQFLRATKRKQTTCSPYVANVNFRLLVDQCLCDNSTERNPLCNGIIAESLYE